MYLKVNEQNIYYQRTGRGKNLVILHGWGQDSSSFWPLVDLLKQDFTLWLIDLPGFGRSDLPRKSLTVSDYAEIVKEFLKKNRLIKPICLGHSNGGRILIKLCSSYPDLVEKLILEDSSGIKPKQDIIKPLFYALAKISHFVPNLFGLKIKLRYHFYNSLEADYLKAGEMKETLTNMLAEDLTSDLAKITVPTFVIWGEKDKAVPLKDGKKIYQLIPDSRLEVLGNVGHFPHLEDLGKFVYLVKDFCND